MGAADRSQGLDDEGFGEVFEALRQGVCLRLGRRVADDHAEAGRAVHRAAQLQQPAHRPFLGPDPFQGRDLACLDGQDRLDLEHGSQQRAG